MCNETDRWVMEKPQILSKINPEIKREWLRELRSGKYRQGAKVLKTYDAEEGAYRYCPLGVLCDIALKREKVIELSVNGVCFFGITPDDAIRYGSFPPPEIRTWVNINDETMEWIAYLHDNKNRTFGEIADFIEEEL